MRSLPSSPLRRAPPDALPAAATSPPPSSRTWTVPFLSPQLQLFLSWPSATCASRLTSPFRRIARSRARSEIHGADNLAPRGSSSPRPRRNCLRSRAARRARACPRARHREPVHARNSRCPVVPAGDPTPVRPRRRCLGHGVRRAFQGLSPPGHPRRRRSAIRTHRSRRRAQDRRTRLQRVHVRRAHDSGLRRDRAGRHALHRNSGVGALELETNRYRQRRPRRAAPRHPRPRLLVLYRPSRARVPPLRSASSPPATVDHRRTLRCPATTASSPSTGRMARTRWRPTVRPWMSVAVRLPAPSLVFQRAGSDPHSTPLSAPPYKATLLDLAGTRVIISLALVNCLVRDRLVVYAQLLDDDAAPIGSAIPIADARDFAARAAGDTLELFLVRDDGVFSLSARCAPPTQ